MAKVTVKVIGLNKAIKDMESYLAQKNRQLLGDVAAASLNMQKDAKKLAPIDLGELKRSITHVVKQRSGIIEGEVNSEASYSAYVEFGTSPHWPPISALQGWADRHGIPAYQVAKSISQKGTPAQPFMDPAYQKEKPKFIKSVIRTFNTP